MNAKENDVFQSVSETVLTSCSHRANYDFEHSHICDIKAHSVKTYTTAINPLVPELNILSDWQKTRV
jgi:hypothetical protein